MEQANEFALKSGLNHARLPQLLFSRRNIFHGMKPRSSSFDQGLI